jgi:hypothetical protein
MDRTASLAQECDEEDMQIDLPDQHHEDAGRGVDDLAVGREGIEHGRAVFVSQDNARGDVSVRLCPFDGEGGRTPLWMFSLRSHFSVGDSALRAYV